jgi:hypothetical protein
MPSPPAVGWVRIESADPPLSVTARLADERPNLDSGFGGWDVVERPRRRPLTSWKSSPVLQLTLPLLLDQWTSGASIERQIEQIEKLGQPTASDGEPPQLRIYATGGAVPFTGRVWVLNDLAFGDALMNTLGDRVRQYLTLTLIEYLDDVYVVERSAANRRRRKARKKKHGAPAKRIVAKRKSSARRGMTTRATLLGDASASADDFGAGEDLLTIAARELGDADRWVEIAQLNGLRDPRAITPGQVLRLP